MIHQIPICPDNGESAGDMFHPRRITAAVKPIRHGNEALRRMIRQQKGQLDLRMVLFCTFYHACRQRIKPAVMTDDKFANTPTDDMLLNSRRQQRSKFRRRLSVPD